MKILKLLSVALLALFIGCGGGDYELKKKSLTFIQAVSYGDVGAVAKLSGVEQRFGNTYAASLRRSEIAGLVKIIKKKMDKNGEIDELEASEVTGNEQVKKVKVKIMYKNGTVEDNYVVFNNINGEWFVRF